jgi:hypothetical protein
MWLAASCDSIRSGDVLDTADREKITMDVFRTAVDDLFPEGKFPIYSEDTGS